MFSRVCALALCFGLARTARATPDVLLRQVNGLRPGLCDALRIQLTGVAVVSCEVDGSSEASSEQRIAQLMQAVARSHAVLGAFLVSDTHATTVQLVLVGSAEDSALIRFEPIRNRAEPDVDRSLALKIGDALDVLQRARAYLNRPVLAAALLAPPQAERPRSLASGLLELGYGIQSGALLRGNATATLGYRHAGARLAIEASLSAFVTSTVRERSDAGVVDARAWGGSAALRALRVWTRMELGAYGAIGVERQHASGQSRFGDVGRGDLNAAALSVGVDARIELFRGAYLRFYPGVTWLPVAPQFALDRDVTLRVGHVRAELPLAIGVRTP